MVGCRNGGSMNLNQQQVYQAFRWWGVGTLGAPFKATALVYQAFRWWGVGTMPPKTRTDGEVYQAFRWWGVGTLPLPGLPLP